MNIDPHNGVSVRLTGPTRSMLTDALTYTWVAKARNGSTMSHAYTVHPRDHPTDQLVKHQQGFRDFAGYMNVAWEPLPVVG